MADHSIKNPRAEGIAQLVKYLQQNPHVVCICRASNGEVKTVKSQCSLATQLYYLVNFRPVGDIISRKREKQKEWVSLETQ